jgi:DNA repair exonuclease SbcCD ATPase subunit
MKRAVTFCLVGSLLILAGCTSAYYEVMQKLGKEKRDILVQRILDAKKDQEQTKEQLKTTMESFQELTGFQGGDLEKSYKKLNNEYERAESQANKLRDKIKSIDQVSSDLFSEWQKEIDEMHNRQLKDRSETMLRDAKHRQAEYMRAMQTTEEKMSPVLTAFHDQVLFLKHNLNARAIGSLKSTSAKINGDVDTLIRSMDNSMAEADRLISTLGNTDRK